MNITWTEYLNVFFFVYLPYLAIGFFIAGLAYRVMNDNRNIQALSTQFLRNDKMLKWGSNLFHYAIIFVLIGHIIGLLTPEPLYDWLISNETKRLLAITMGCASGIVALVGICLLMMRRFTDARVRANSSMEHDPVVLRNFLRIISDRSLFLSRKFNEFALQNLETRIISYLKKHTCIQNLQEVALILGVARPSLSRTIATLVEQGIIKKDSSGYILA